MLDLTLLTKEQILGDNSLEVLKKYDTTCGITDFAILLGGFVSPDYHTREGNSLKNRTCSWWSKTPDEYGEIYAVTRNGQFDTAISTSRLESIRPTVKYSSISNGQTQENNGIKEVIYGEYPQWVVDQDNSIILEKMYNNGKLKTTGKSYTTDSVNYLDRSENFKARSYIEYEYNGEKFIRFTGNSNCDGKTLSDRRIAKKDEVYWVKVEPLVWLVDEIEDVAFTKYAIVAGVKFRDRDNEEKTVEFESSNLKWFLDKYLSKDILTLKEKNQISSTTDDIDSLFEEAITRMNEINELGKQKSKILM